MAPRRIMSPEAARIEAGVAQVAAFRINAENQLDKLLKGETDAKLGLIVAQASGLHIVLGGDPGGGKTVLLDHSHRTIEGVSDEDVAKIPAQADLTATRLVGGETPIETEVIAPNGTRTIERKTVKTDPIIRPNTKVVNANEVSRTNPMAINAGMDAFEKAEFTTTAGVVRLPDLLYGIFNLNPHEQHEMTFPIASAMGSRTAIGAVMGEPSKDHYPHTRTVDPDDLEVMQGWRPKPEEMDTIISTEDLMSLRSFIQENVIMTSELATAAVAQVHRVRLQLKQAGIHEAPRRLLGQVSRMSRTVAALEGSAVVKPEHVDKALTFAITGRLCMLSTGGDHRDIAAQTDKIKG